MTGIERHEAILLAVHPEFGPLTQADKPLYQLIINAIEPLVDGQFEIVDIPTDPTKVALKFTASTQTKDGRTIPLETGAGLFTDFLSPSRKLRDGLLKQGHPEISVMQVVSSHIRTAAEVMTPTIERLRTLEAIKRSYPAY